MRTIEEQAGSLNELLHKCNDSIKGYEQAADSADGNSLKLYLHNIALERKDMAMQLKSMIAALGGDITDSGTVKGAMHRGWLNVKAFMASNTEENILEECLRGEKQLVEDYMEVVKEAGLSKENNNVLARQMGNVQERITRMDSMKEQVD